MIVSSRQRDACAPSLKTDFGRGRPLFSSSRIDDADFGAPPGKSETTDASESKRDVHQRSVRDDHETTESFGTCVFFLLCVCVCLFDERQERARARSQQIRFFLCILLLS